MNRALRRLATIQRHLRGGCVRADLLIELRFGAVLAAPSLSVVALLGFDQPACVFKEQGEMSRSSPQP